MANIKKSLDYFGFSVDFFQDRKIKRLQRVFAEKGVMIYIFILTEIYRNDGYFLVWDSDYPEDIARALGENFKTNLVSDVVNLCVNKFRLFDKDLFDTQSILTSKGIQRRYLASKEGILKRSLEVEKLFPKYRLIGDDLETLENPAEINGVLRRSTAENAVNDRKSAENGVLRSKEKEIEEKEIEEKEIEENRNNIPPIPPQGENVKKFVKPSVEEIDVYAKQYIQDKGFLIDFNAESFFDFYESKGWFVGRNKMKDWKASVRNWINNDKPKNTFQINLFKQSTTNENQVLKEFLDGK